MPNECAPEPTPPPTPVSPAPPPSLCPEKGGWPGRVADGHEGIVTVYGSRFEQHEGFYQIDWPIVKLRHPGGSSANDGTWSLVGGCGKGNAGQYACNAICISLSGTANIAGTTQDCKEEKVFYPSAASFIADTCTQKYSQKNLWYAKKATENCEKPVKYCLCHGTMPNECTPAPTPPPTPVPPAPPLPPCPERGGWPGRVADGHEGIVTVYGSRFEQHRGFYQIDWPIVKLRGLPGGSSANDGTWTLVGGCGNSNLGKDACKAICTSVSGTTNYYPATTQACKENNVSYPSEASFIADTCTQKYSQKNQWYAKQATENCENPLTQCQCHGTMPKCSS